MLLKARLKHVIESLTPFILLLDFAISNQSWCLLPLVKIISEINRCKPFHSYSEPLLRQVWPLQHSAHYYPMVSLWLLGRLLELPPLLGCLSSVQRTPMTSLGHAFNYLPAGTEHRKVQHCERQSYSLDPLITSPGWGSHDRFSFADGSRSNPSLSTSSFG